MATQLNILTEYMSNGQKITYPVLGALAMYTSDPMYELKTNQVAQKFECISIKLFQICEYYRSYKKSKCIWERFIRT